MSWQAFYTNIQMYIIFYLSAHIGTPSNTQKCVLSHLLEGKKVVALGDNFRMNTGMVDMVPLIANMVTLMTNFRVFE
jgi:hypothetical protein